METPSDFTQFVVEVVITAREITPRRSVELGTIHGFCTEVAHKRASHLLEFLASVNGLAALSAALSQMPDLVIAKDVSGSMWTFVRPDVKPKIS